MALVGNLSKISGELQAHPFARADGPLVFLLQPVEEIADRHAQNLRDLEEAAGRDAVDAAFVLVGLLVGHADQVGELLLRQAEHDPPLADAGSYIPVDILGPARRSPSRGGLGRRCVPSARSGAPAKRRTPDLLAIFHAFSPTLRLTIHQRRLPVVSR